MFPRGEREDRDDGEVTEPCRKIWELERQKPAGASGERLVIDPTVGRYLVGRSRRCDLHLLTPTASRVHAELRLSDDGGWQIWPRAGRVVLVDGEPVVESCRMRDGMTLVLGEDELLCRHAARASAWPESSGSASLVQRSSGWIALGLVVVALGVWLCQGVTG